MKKRFLYLIVMLYMLHQPHCYAMENKDQHPSPIQLPSEQGNWNILIDPTTPEKDRTILQRLYRHLWTNYTEDGQKHLTGIMDETGQHETEKVFQELKKEIEQGHENYQISSKTKRRIDACHSLAKILCARLTTPPFERADIHDAAKLLQLRSKDSLTHDLIKQLAEKTLNAIEVLSQELATNKEIVSLIKKTTIKEDDKPK